VATALLGWVAALAPGLFAGAALYVSLVEHPARLSLGSRAAVHEFGPSYRRGAALQAPLALIGALAGIGRWALGGSVWWLAGGIALGALVPYTLVIVLPTSTRLLDPALDRDSRGSVLLTSAVCSPR
jgi:anthrone oxygenase-like protein